MLEKTKKKRSLRNGKLKANRASGLNEEPMIRCVNMNTENHKKQHLATLERLTRGDENELERYLVLEKVIASKQLRLAVEIEEEKRTRLEKMVAAQLMLALIKGVGVVLSFNPILKSW